LTEVVDLVGNAVPELTLTVDPVEGRGFEYHTGVAFTIFARQSAAELGRGGRYLAHGEWATGATLYMDTVLDVLPGPEEARRVFLPFGTPFAVGQALRDEGWVTLAGLAQVGDEKVEAGRLACGHLLMAGRVIKAK
jgi:ATP phosphoribosyltransferase regulatory subunit